MIWCFSSKYLKAKRVALYRGILFANSLRNLCHGFVIVEVLGVLQLVEVIHDPGVGLPAPHLGHQLLLVGGLQTLAQSLSASVQIYSQIRHFCTSIKRQSVIYLESTQVLA